MNESYLVKWKINRLKLYQNKQNTTKFNDKRDAIYHHFHLNNPYHPSHHDISSISCIIVTIPQKRTTKRETLFAIAFLWLNLMISLDHRTSDSRNKREIGTTLIHIKLVTLDHLPLIPKLILPHVTNRYRLWMTSLYLNSINKSTLYIVVISSERSFRLVMWKANAIDGSSFCRHIRRMSWQWNELSYLDRLNVLTGCWTRWGSR